MGPKVSKSPHWFQKRLVAEWLHAIFWTNDDWDLKIIYTGQFGDKCYFQILNAIITLNDHITLNFIRLRPTDTDYAQLRVTPNNNYAHPVI